MRSTRILFATVTVALAASLAMAPASSGAPQRHPSADRRIPEGGPPQLPYLDVPHHRIVDGSRQVDVTGLQGTVTRLFKVDGGYVLGRLVSGGRSDLAFVTTSGDRRVLTSRWLSPFKGTLDPGLVVSHDGSRIVFNTRRTAREDYRDTAVMTVPGGHVTSRRTFSLTPRLLADSGSRVLMSLDTSRSPSGRVLWWTPGRSAVTVIASPAAADAADLTAGAYVVRRPQQGIGVEGIPPRSTPHWGSGDTYPTFGSWSPDDRHVAGTDEIIAGTEEVELYHVHDAATGADVADFHVAGVPEITWETDSTLLMRAYGPTDDGGSASRFVRCNLAEECEYAGPVGNSRYAPYVVASRRTS